MKNDPADSPERPTAGEAGEGADLVSDAVSLIDSLIDYFAARLHLEGHRLQARGRAVVARLTVLVIAIMVVLLGLAFLGSGLSVAISRQLGSRSAGLMVVGAAYMLIGIIAAWIVARRRS